MRHYSEFGFADPENAKRYSQGSPANFVPGFSVMHCLTLQLISESVGPDGHVLVLGAGGGIEMKVFAEARPGWKLTGVDPSPEMIAAGKDSLAPMENQINWVQAYIPDSPPGPFDAATCLLTLHLIPDDGHKLEALQAIHQRLKPGGRFVLVDNCFDRGSPIFQQQLDRFLEHARNQGVPNDILERVGPDVANKTESIPPEREVELLAQAGFQKVELFFAALTWRGWFCEA